MGSINREFSDGSPERRVVVEYIACYLTHISENCEKEDIVSMKTIMENPFHSPQIPHVTLADYIRRIAKYTVGYNDKNSLKLISTETLLRAVAQIELIRCYNEDSCDDSELYEVSNFTMYKMILVAVMRQAQLFDGLTISADYMANVGGTKVDLHDLKEFFCQLFNRFENITDSQYINFYKRIATPYFHKLCNHAALPLLKIKKHRTVKKINISPSKKYSSGTLLSPIQENFLEY
jgi:hypothetical protein